jgi:hypothetical protein
MTQTSNERSTPEVARDEAADVARTAADAGGNVAGTAGDQARRVAEETTRQARNLVEEGRTQLTDQARNGQRKAAGSLHALADQLNDMASKSDGSGMAPDLVQQAAERTRTVASWLEDREPGDLLTEVRSFARRKPGVFLAGAALAGVLAGRLTRGVVAAQSDSGDSGSSGNAPTRQQNRPQSVNPAYTGEPAAALPPTPPPPGYSAPPGPGYSSPPAPGYSMPPAGGGVPPVGPPDGGPTLPPTGPVPPGGVLPPHGAPPDRPLPPGPVTR